MNTQNFNLQNSQLRKPFWTNFKPKGTRMEMIGMALALTGFAGYLMYQNVSKEQQKLPYRAYDSMLNPYTLMSGPSVFADYMGYWNQQSNH